MTRLKVMLTDWIMGEKHPYAKLKIPDWQMYVDTTGRTLAGRLQALGYATANVGKWHLGHDPAYCPENQGFDVTIVGYRSGAPSSYFYPYNGNRRDNMHPPNLQEGTAGEYLTCRLTWEAEQFILDNKDRPFFLYFPHYAVHMPLQAPDSLVQHYEKRISPGLRHGKPTYAARVHSVDQSVGAIMAVLQREGLSNNTVGFFTCDNGGLTLWDITDNSPPRIPQNMLDELVRWRHAVGPQLPVDNPDYMPEN
jgi:arylsulfatase A-like enzyme